MKSRKPRNGYWKSTGAHDYIFNGVELWCIARVDSSFKTRN